MAVEGTVVEVKRGEPVPAHVAVGGWWSAMRLTFFYAFEATPPFAPRCATPPMGFGLSRDVPPLEYATHLELLHFLLAAELRTELARLG